MLKKLFEGIKLYKNMNIPYTLDIFLPQNEPMPDIYYTPKKEIIFEDGKYLIFTLHPKIKKRVDFRVNVMNPLITATSFCGLFGLFIVAKYNMSIPILTMILFHLFKSYKDKLYKTYIKEIYLLSDGKTIEIVTPYERAKFDIKQVKKLKHKELVLYFSADILDTSYVYPIIMGQRLFQIEPYYQDSEIFPAICNSAYIKLPKYEKKKIITI